jgi:glycosyltransferase involved in cell wall biosynthesis
MSSSGTEFEQPQPRIKVAVLLGSPFLYGMERSVIELFDKLRPEVEPHFVLTYTAFRQQLPILQEIEARRLPHSFLPDKREWPRIGKPRSLRDAWRLGVSIVRGNLCLLQAALGKDALYVPSLLGAFHSVLAALYLRMRRRRVLHHFHDFTDKPSFILKLWTVLVTDFIHNTKLAYEAAAASNPAITRKKNISIPYLLDFRTMDEGPTIGDGCGKREIFFVGQVSYHKGIDLLIEAFEMLKPDDARLNIIGAPPPHYKEQFEALLHRCSQTCDVRFLGYQSDVLRHLRSAYLYVHPSPPTRFHESYGRGVVEAMSLGVPSVCFRSGSLQEIVVNGQTGIVCEEETPQCLAEAIRRFLGDPMFRENCGKDARIRYETVYSQLKVRPAWVEFFGRDMDHGA